MLDSALTRCVGDVDVFLREHWTQQPHLHRAGPEDVFDDLLSIDQVDDILTTMSLRTPAFRLVRDGSTLPTSTYTRSGTVGGRRVNDLPDVGRIFALFEDGASIVLQGLHRYWEPVTRLCRDLEETLTHPLQANAYVTPPVAAGLNVHHDTHDVFAMQTFGTKQWVIHEPVVEQPLSSHGWQSGEHDPGPPVMDVELEPGDCLYVPRGTPHAARTVDRPSIHLTVGIRARTWHDVFRAVVERAADDLAFREALPAGFASDPAGFADVVATRLKDMASFVEATDAGEVAEEASARFWSGRQPHLRGHLLDLVRVDDLSDDDVVERRVGVGCHVREDGDRVTADLGDRTVDMPAVVRPALDRILDRGRLRVSDLADLLDAESRLVVVRRLLREGLLRFPPDPRHRSRP